jgi:hypothetical protein
MKILRYKHRGSDTWLTKNIITSGDEEFLMSIQNIEDFDYKIYQCITAKIDGKMLQYNSAGAMINTGGSE